MNVHVSDQLTNKRIVKMIDECTCKSLYYLIGGKI